MTKDKNNLWHPQNSHLRTMASRRLAKRLKAGDKVLCIYAGDKLHQALLSPRNRLVLSKVYTIDWADEILGEVRLRNKGATWQACRFIKVKFDLIPVQV